MKNEQQNEQNKNMQLMHWPVTDSIRPVITSPGEGNGMSISTDPATVKQDNDMDTIKNSNAPVIEPEINTAVYELRTTEEKIPIMKGDQKQG